MFISDCAATYLCENPFDIDLWTTLEELSVTFHDFEFFVNVNLVIKIMLFHDISPSNVFKIVLRCFKLISPGVSLINDSYSWIELSWLKLWIKHALAEYRAIYAVVYLWAIIDFMTILIAWRTCFLIASIIEELVS